MVCEATGADANPKRATGSFAYRIAADGTVAALELADAEAQVGGAGLLWAHIDGTDPVCLAWLEADAHLPPAMADAMQAVETRPRATATASGALVNLRGLGAVHSEDADDLVSIRLWAERGRVLTLSFYPFGALPDVRLCVEAGQVRDPGDLIAAFAETITERLDPVVGELGDRLDDLEGRFARGDTSIRAPLGEVRRTAVEYRRFLLPQRDAIVRLATTDFPWLADDDRVHIREAGERAQRMAEELDSVRDRAGVLSDQLTDLRSDEANQRMLVLSIVAAVFLPLTFLTGLLGMNVRGIPFAQARWAFMGVVLLCLAIGGGMAIWFKRQRWV